MQIGSLWGRGAKSGVIAPVHIIEGMIMREGYSGATRQLSIGQSRNVLHGNYKSGSLLLRIGATTNPDCEPKFTTQSACGRIIYKELERALTITLNWIGIILDASAWSGQAVFRIYMTSC